jgi:hypothetical protein
MRPDVCYHTSTWPLRSAQGIGVQRERRLQVGTSQATFGELVRQRRVGAGLMQEKLAGRAAVAAVAGCGMAPSQDALALPSTPLTPLIGRTYDEAAVIRLPQRENLHLVTLTGTGGAGEHLRGSTRLADATVSEVLDSLADSKLAPAAPAQTPESRSAAGWMSSPEAAPRREARAGRTVPDGTAGYMCLLRVQVPVDRAPI